MFDLGQPNRDEEQFHGASRPLINFTVVNGKTEMRVQRMKVSRMHFYDLLKYSLLMFVIAGRGTMATAGALVANPGSSRGGLVVAVEPLAARAGAEILARGGNAVDAAVATALALAVTHPEAGNVGGGGFMVVWLAQPGECFTVDYRETAPRAATPTMFLDARGRIDPEKVHLGWLVVGVPGTPRGLWTAHRRAGRLAWRQLVQPAIRLAEGFTIDPVLARGLKNQEPDFLRFGEPARVYFNKAGKPFKAGDQLQLPDLAHTLRLLADRGPAGFYSGEVAEKVAAAMRHHGGIITRADLEEYRALVRPAVRGRYRGYDILTIGPPSAGGTVLVEMLHILEGFDLTQSGAGTPKTLHFLSEAMKRAYYDRAKYLGDPDFVEMPLSRLLSGDHAEQWRQGIGARATPSATFGGDILTQPESPQTTHFSIVDAEGNAVANTTTLEGSYGAKVIAPGTGFLLNNEMHDFNVLPGKTDTTGLIGTPPNMIQPRKRMLSSQTPTIVLKDGKPVLVLGSPGGRTITNTVLQVLSNVVDHHLPIQAAVDAPRIHHAWQPDVVRLEGKFPRTTVQALAQWGHRVDHAPEHRQGDCHAIFIDPRTNIRYPGVDRRLRGAVVGVE